MSDRVAEEGEDYPRLRASYPRWLVKRILSASVPCEGVLGHSIECRVWKGRHYGDTPWNKSNYPKGTAHG